MLNSFWVRNRKYIIVGKKVAEVVRSCVQGIIATDVPRGNGQVERITE